MIERKDELFGPGGARGERVSAAMLALRAGRPVVLVDDEREHEADLAFAASRSTPALVNLCLNRARGLLCIAMWPADAERLGIARLPSNKGDVLETPFAWPLSLRNGTTGISASARSATIVAVAEGVDAASFAYPGHVATLVAHPSGVAGRLGHTEGVLDLLRLADVAGPGVLCEILDEDGEIARAPRLKQLATELNLPLLYLRDICDALTRS